MKPFEYATPATLEEATGLLANRWGETEILAGGTDLITALKQGITQPTRVVSLKNILDLRGIQSEPSKIRIGAMTSLGALSEHRSVQEHFPAIISAIEGIGSAQLLSIGTLGGDLCQRPRCWYFRNGLGLLAQQNGESLVREGDNRYHAIFGNDGPAQFVNTSSLGPALLALDATLSVAGPDGATRQVPAREFFRAPRSENERETALRPNEILTAVEIPIQRRRNATYEVRHREGLDWPYVTATVAFEVSGGQARNARVVLGHVAPVPWVSQKAAEVLNGARLNSDVAAKCGEAAAQGATPLSRNGYKVQMVKAAVKRAVLAAAQA